MQLFNQSMPVDVPHVLIPDFRKLDVPKKFSPWIAPEYTMEWSSFLSYGLTAMINAATATESNNRSWPLEVLQDFRHAPQNNTGEILNENNECTVCIYNYLQVKVELRKL